MLLPSCGNENLNVFLKIRLCKNKREREENKELVFSLLEQLLTSLKMYVCFWFCFKSPEKIIVISKLAVIVSERPSSLLELWINLLTFLCDMHYPFCSRVEKLRHRIKGKIFNSSNGIALPSLLVGAETQFQHVPWRARLAVWPTPSSPWVRSIGRSQPQTPHSFQMSERQSKAKGCETVTAVKLLSVMKATESSMLGLWTCGVITSSHVAWKDPEVVVVCMWPLISLMILY